MKMSLDEKKHFINDTGRIIDRTAWHVKWCIHGRELTRVCDECRALGMRPSVLVVVVNNSPAPTSQST